MIKVLRIDFLPVMQDGLVLDLFFGSGTTGVVSKKLNRNYLGIELNPEYIEIAKNRINKLI